MHCQLSIGTVNCMPVSQNPLKLPVTCAAALGKLDGRKLYEGLKVAGKALRDYVFRIPDKAYSITLGVEVSVGLRL